MTRFVWDKFSKDFLETFLSPYGEITVNKKVTSEIKEIDVYFTPKTTEIPDELGLLGKLAQYPCLFEPYRNPVNLGNISECISKRFAVCEQLKRESHRHKQRLLDSDLPKLWILTPTASQKVVNAFSGQLQDNWGQGIYFLPEALGTAVVVIHQLPNTSETLWLRLLGRGGTRNKAIDELERINPNNSLKLASLKLLYNLSKDLEALSQKNLEDREFIMRLTPFYEQGIEQATQRGIEQGLQQGLQQEASKLVFRLIQRRLGEIPKNLRETINNLSVEQLEDLGEALLDFESQEHLLQWLDTLK